MKDRVFTRAPSPFWALNSNLYDCLHIFETAKTSAQVFSLSAFTFKSAKRKVATNVKITFLSICSFCDPDSSRSLGLSGALIPSNRFLKIFCLTLLIPSKEFGLKQANSPLLEGEILLKKCQSNLKTFHHYIHASFSLYLWKNVDTFLRTYPQCISYSGFLGCLRNIFL